MLDGHGETEHTPTQSQRDRVKKLAAIGIPKHSICKLIGVSLMTLNKHYQNELDIGLDDMLEQVGSKAYELAIEGNDKMIGLVLKTKGSRSGWQEKQVIETVDSAETQELRKKIADLEAVHIKDY